jgi:hypothetical protein
MPSSKPFITDEMTPVLLNCGLQIYRFLDYTKYIPPVDTIESKVFFEVLADMPRGHLYGYSWTYLLETHQRAADSLTVPTAGARFVYTTTGDLLFSCNYYLL